MRFLAFFSFIFFLPNLGWGNLPTLDFSEGEYPPAGESVTCPLSEFGEKEARFKGISDVFIPVEISSARRIVRNRRSGKQTVVIPMAQLRKKYFEALCQVEVVIGTSEGGSRYLQIRYRQPQEPVSENPVELESVPSIHDSPGLFPGLAEGDPLSFFDDEEECEELPSPRLVAAAPVILPRLPEGALVIRCGTGVGC